LLAAIHLQTTLPIASEGSGMTKKIGSIHISRELLSLQSLSLQEENPFEIDIPGVLFFDTPGNQSVAQCQSRRIIQSLCDIAIIMIDLMHGLERQTLESLEILRKLRVPFLIAINKVDRLHGWKGVPSRSICIALDDQNAHCIQEFNERFISPFFFPYLFFIFFIPSEWRESKLNFWSKVLKRSCFGKISTIPRQFRLSQPLLKLVKAFQISYDCLLLSLKRGDSGYALLSLFFSLESPQVDRNR
jgi:hypothetical protein